MGDMVMLSASAWDSKGDMDIRSPAIYLGISDEKRNVFWVSSYQASWIDLPGAVFSRFGMLIEFKLDSFDVAQSGKLLCTTIYPLTEHKRMYCWIDGMAVHLDYARIQIPEMNDAGQR